MAKKKQVVNEDATKFMQSESEPMFGMCKTEDGIIILLGKYKVSSKTFKTFEEAEAYIMSKPYELIINVAVLISKTEFNENKTNN